MTKADIIENIYEKVGLSKEESARIVELVLEIMSLKQMLDLITQGPVPYFNAKEQNPVFQYEKRGLLCVRSCIPPVFRVRRYYSFLINSLIISSSRFAGYELD